MKKVFIAACMLCAFGVHAFSALPPDTIRQLESKVVLHTLPNGMKVLILRRPFAPLVSFEMMFHVGGVDEDRGKTGLAHLFEHMMFKGSRTVGTKDYDKEKPILVQIDTAARELIQEQSKGNSADPKKITQIKTKLAELEAEHQQWVIPSEFDEIYQRAGGEGLNAFTAQDMTAFIVSLPANKWELWPIMESDRMAHPVLREFYKEKDVVMEERRMRYDNSPQGKIWENFVALAFKVHPYGSPTIGWTEDIKKLTLSDAEQFFKVNYGPNNATVAIVGDVDPQAVIEKLEKYFVNVASQSIPNRNLPVEPPQTEERRLIINFDSEPSLMIGFHKPNAPHPDNIVVEMIGEILNHGRTSRFIKNIVEKKFAISAWASNGEPGERYPNLFVVGGSPQNPHNNRDLEAALLAEIEKLKKEKVPERELKKIQNQLESEFIHSLASNGGMASQLVYDQTILGDWKLIFEYLERMSKVKPEDIQRVANQYFTTANRSVIYLERGTASGKR